MEEIKIQKRIVVYIVGIIFLIYLFHTYFALGIQALRDVFVAKDFLHSYVASIAILFIVGIFIYRYAPQMLKKQGISEHKTGRVLKEAWIVARSMVLFVLFALVMMMYKMSSYEFLQFVLSTLLGIWLFYYILKSLITRVKGSYKPKMRMTEKQIMVWIAKLLFWSCFFYFFTTYSEVMVIMEKLDDTIFWNRFRILMLLYIVVHVFLYVYAPDELESTWEKPETKAAVVMKKVRAVLAVIVIAECFYSILYGKMSYNLAWFEACVILGLWGCMGLSKVLSDIIKFILRVKKGDDN